MGIENIESPHGLHPDITRRVLQYMGNNIIADGSGVADVVPEGLEAITVKAVQAVHGTKPHIALAIFQDGIYLGR